MNDKLSLLFSRRSIRQYTDGSVSDAIIRDLLEAAMAAPSAVCRDPWDFVVLRDAGLRETIASCLPNGKMLATAPAGLVVCGDLERAHDGSLSYLLQDCSAAIENLLLAAQALGLGACWLGVHPRPDRIAFIRETLELPENVLPVCAIALGYPAETREPRTRYRDEYVHFDRW